MITFIRTYLLNAYTALPLVVCMLIASWSAQASSLTVKHRYSGEEMFRGLFFVEGRYAQAIPELQSLQLSYATRLAKPGDKLVVSQLRNQIVQTIRTQQPRYFDDLRTAFESGNPLAVQSALETGRAITAKVVEQVVKGQRNGQFEVRRENGTCVVLIVYNYCTIIAMCAVVLMLPTVDEVAQTNSKLMTEQLVASICRLSANPA